jgi:hypothetical protein
VVEEEVVENQLMVYMVLVVMVEHLLEQKETVVELEEMAETVVEEVAVAVVPLDIVVMVVKEKIFLVLVLVVMELVVVEEVQVQMELLVMLMEIIKVVEWVYLEKDQMEQVEQLIILDHQVQEVRVKHMVEVVEVPIEIIFLLLHLVVEVL